MSVVALVAIAAVATTVVLVGSASSSTDAPCPGADGRSSELRRCLAESLAYVVTPVSAGSGVLLADGYVVTNAHVIDPYPTADLAFDGGAVHTDVPVVGVDAFADVAVLGPIDTEREGLELEPIPDFDEIDEPDVFLAGYPGGIETGVPQIALAGGLLSRLREDATFGHTYLQTDAAIAGGQSGGALVDEDGTVLGISGLGFADEFALALSSDDVAASVEKILAGDGDERRVLPTLKEAGEETVWTVLADDHPSRRLVIPSAPTRREVALTVDGSAEVAVTVTTAWGEMIGVNHAGMEAAEAHAGEVGDEGLLADVELLDRPSDGHYRFDVPSDEDVVVYISRWSFSETRVRLHADVPFTVFDDTVKGDLVSVGSPSRGVVDGFTFEVIHSVTLRRGDRVEINVHAAARDPYLVLLAPDEYYDPAIEPDADDGGGGLYDLDAAETFDIDETGTWRIVVGTWDGIVGGYELTVDRAD